MLVIEKAKALLLNLSNPERVLSTVPTSKPYKFKGKDLVVIPHRVKESTSLRALGIKAPSPILHYYDWPGRFTPYDHQRMTAAFLTMHSRCLVLNEIGTGKTQSALWAADYLMNAGVVKKVLILSPLSTLERVWGDGIFTGLIHRKHVVLHGAAARRKKLLKADVDFYVINHDGFSIISEDAHNMFDLIIVDEATVLRNPSTARFKMFRKFIARNENARVWLMTGTPTPNEPTDAWALGHLIKNEDLPRTYTAFKEQVMMKVGQWKFIARPESVDIVSKVLQPSVRYTRDECFDLPDTVVQTRRVMMTAEQRFHYETMVKHFITSSTAHDGAEITAVNAAIRLQKLVQIACGVAYSDDGQNIELDCNDRVAAVKEVIQEAGGKVILFVPLTGTLHMLESKLNKLFSTAVVNGQVSANKRNDIFHNFQNSQDPRVLIAHPATMAHGLTLTEASTVIWYGPTTSNEQYVQANGRIERIGKRHVSNVVHIAATDLEEKMYQRLASKQALQDLLLEVIERGTE